MEKKELKLTKIRLEKDVYAELVKRYGIKNLSTAINQILREVLFRGEERGGQERPRTLLEELRQRARRREVDGGVQEL